MLGALGGFFLPPAFGALGRWSGVPQMAFVPLLGLTAWSLLWLHIVVVRLRTASPVLDSDGRLPMQYTTASPL
jgi:NNP family nitrate/nitrite transporter-like MFS transporter